MSEPKSKDRVELELFLELRAEDGPRTIPHELAKQYRQEKVLEKRSPRAYQALGMAHEALVRFRIGRVNELLPQTALACLALLEALDQPADEAVHIVRPDIVKDAIAYRLGATRKKAPQQEGMKGLAAGYSGGFVATSGIYAGGGGASERKDGGTVTAGTGGWGGGGGAGPVADGGCSASTSAPPGQGGCASGVSPFWRNFTVGIDLSDGFFSSWAAIPARNAGGQ